MNNQFTSDYESILEAVHSFRPDRYAGSRNFIDGKVSRLSPYISRGVISTRYVYENLLSRGYAPRKIEKFIQELAWRDYWQQVWSTLGDDIDSDLKRSQPNTENHEMPEAIVKARTGIEAIDKAILEFYESGYMHNHVRMYVAAIACTIGKSHWRVPANWLYYHLLDGDWASNALSWQWVAGSNSGKQYVADQENINKYCHSTQKGTFLDVNYEEFATMEIPEILKSMTTPDLQTPLPDNSTINVDSSLPTLLYNWYNLDPIWRNEMKANRILLLEPSVFQRYPISQQSLDFMLALSENINDIQVYVGEFKELKEAYELNEFFFKEHPLNKQYQGTEDSRDWMFSVKGYYRSFFAFWKKCKKEIKQPSLF